MPANIGAELQALPLEYMLGAPLAATITAQALAAKTTVAFIEEVGLEADATTGELKTRTATFDFTQPVPDPANPGQMLNVESVLTVPILAIIPVPYIRVSDLNFSFEFKIRDVQTAESKNTVTGSFGFSTSTTTTTKLGGGFLGFLGAVPSGSVEAKTNVKMDVSTTYQATNRQSTDRSATFKMTLNAVQDAVPEGLARVLTILSDAIQSQKK